MDWNLWVSGEQIVKRLLKPACRRRFQPFERGKLEEKHDQEKLFKTQLQLLARGRIVTYLQDEKQSLMPMQR